MIGHSMILFEDEKAKLFDHIKNLPPSVNSQRTGLIIDILINSGLRAGELCNLRLCHTPKYLGTDVLAVYRGKNDRDRDVPISPRLTGDITKYIKETKET